ncbi:hypothetical protein SLOPH_2746 [Spraguea lophii 42_110]|uniref:Uncharacterized protein n=1 Tax=Spraguea lophii (strain 42_110) TaxID=1358809 RepID=S7W5V9_SPRLO|nr:hypothetical protein SLOPH_2746 [Spraguea lophii 42_110]
MSTYVENKYVGIIYSMVFLLDFINFFLCTSFCAMQSEFNSDIEMISTWNNSHITKTYIFCNNLDIALDIIPLDKGLFEITLDYFEVLRFLELNDLPYANLKRRYLNIIRNKKKLFECKSISDISNELSEYLKYLEIFLKDLINECTTHSRRYFEIKRFSEKKYHNKIKNNFVRKIFYKKNLNSLKFIKKIEALAEYNLNRLKKTQKILYIEHSRMFPNDYEIIMNSNITDYYQEFIKTTINNIILLSTVNQIYNCFSEIENYIIEAFFILYQIERILTSIICNDRSQEISLLCGYDYMNMHTDFAEFLDIYDFMRYIFINTQLQKIAKVEKKYYKKLGMTINYNIAVNKELFLANYILIGSDASIQSFLTLYNSFKPGEFHNSGFKILEKKKYHYILSRSGVGDDQLDDCDMLTAKLLGH